MSNHNRPIVLVEDNPMDIDLTRRAFARRNLINPLIVARDGEEVLELSKRWDSGEDLPVVILLDINLPKLSGLEVLHDIKTNPRIQKIPVIMLTASEEDHDIQVAYKLGANSYIVKPIDFEKFVEVAAQIELYWNVINRLPD